MEVKWNLLEKSEGELRVITDSNEWGVYTQRAYRNLVKQLKVPGFRNGNVPDSIAKKRIKPEQITNEAMSFAINELFTEGLKDIGEIIVVGAPTFMDAIPTVDGGMEFVYKMVLQPEAKLGEYKGLSVERYNEEVTDEEIEGQIQSILAEYSELVIKDENEPVVLGDTVIMDYEGTVDGKAFVGGSATNYATLVGNRDMMPGFEDQLLGMKTNETKTFEIVLPERFGEEYGNKTAEYKVTVTTVKSKVAPTLNEEFIKEMNHPGIETVEDLKKEIGDVLKGHKVVYAENKYVTDLMDLAIDNATIELPDLLIEQAIDELLPELERNLRNQGMEYLGYRAMTGKTDEEIRDDLRPAAERRVKSRLVAFAIAQAEGINVTEEEIEQEIRTAADVNGMDFEELRANVQNRIGAIADSIVYRKVSEFLKANANLTNDVPLVEDETSKVE